MSLLRKLKTDNERLPRFETPGVYENVVLVAVDTAKRKKTGGEIIQSLFFLKMAQLDSEGKKIREEDFAFWPTKHDKGGDNFPWYASNLTTTLLELLEIYWPVENLENSFNPFAPMGLTSENYDTEVKKVLGVKKNMDAFNAQVRDLFASHIGSIIGSEHNKALRIKIVPSNDGKYLGLSDNNWVEPVSVAEPRVTYGSVKDEALEAKWKAVQTGTPAAGGGTGMAQPMAAAMANPSGQAIPGAVIPGADQAGIPGVAQPAAGGTIPSAAPQAVTQPQAVQPAAVTPQAQTVAAAQPVAQQVTQPVAEQPIANFPAPGVVPQPQATQPGVVVEGGAPQVLETPFNNGQVKSF